MSTPECIDCIGIASHHSRDLPFSKVLCGQLDVPRILIGYIFVLMIFLEFERMHVVEPSTWHRNDSHLKRVVAGIGRSLKPDGKLQ